MLFTQHAAHANFNKAESSDSNKDLFSGSVWKRWLDSAGERLGKSAQDWVWFSWCYWIGRETRGIFKWTWSPSFQQLPLNPLQERIPASSSFVREQYIKKKKVPWSGAGDLWRVHPTKQRPFFFLPFFLFGLPAPSSLPPTRPGSAQLCLQEFTVCHWGSRASSHGDSFPGSKEVRQETMCNQWINANSRASSRPNKHFAVSSPTLCRAREERGEGHEKKGLCSGKRIKKIFFKLPVCSAMTCNTFSFLFHFLVTGLKAGDVFLGSMQTPDQSVFSHALPPAFGRAEGDGWDCKEAEMKGGTFSTNYPEPLPR